MDLKTELAMFGGDIKAYISAIREELVMHRSYALQLWENCAPDKDDNARIALAQYTDQLLESADNA